MGYQLALTPNKGFPTSPIASAIGRIETIEVVVGSMRFPTSPITEAIGSGVISSLSPSTSWQFPTSPIALAIGNAAVCHETGEFAEFPTSPIAEAVGNNLSISPYFNRASGFQRVRDCRSDR
jgi:hypothetical protein